MGKSDGRVVMHLYRLTKKDIGKELILFISYKSFIFFLIFRYLLWSINVHISTLPSHSFQTNMANYLTGKCHLQQYFQIKKNMRCSCHQNISVPCTKTPKTLVFLFKMTIKKIKPTVVNDTWKKNLSIDLSPILFPLPRVKDHENSHDFNFFFQFRMGRCLQDQNTISHT